MHHELFTSHDGAPAAYAACRAGPAGAGRTGAGGPLCRPVTALQPGSAARLERAFASARRTRRQCRAPASAPAHRPRPRSGAGGSLARSGAQAGSADAPSGRHRQRRRRRGAGAPPGQRPPAAALGGIPHWRVWRRRRLAHRAPAGGGAAHQQPGVEHPLHGSRKRVPPLPLSAGRHLPELCAASTLNRLPSSIVADAGIPDIIDNQYIAL